MRYDLIIVGGGLVGASLAAALRHLPLRVALIDARPPQQNDPRLIALHLGNIEFLQTLGLWPRLQASAAPIYDVHISQQGRFGALRFSHKTANLPALGYVIPACVIEEALNELLAAIPSLTLLRPAQLQVITQEQAEAVLVVNNQGSEEIYRTPLVMAADGTYSTVRKQLGMEADTFDYQQSALVTTTILQRPHHGIAYERFYSQGTVAMLPLLGQIGATIWTADPATIAELQNLSKPVFVERLQKIMGYRLGRLLTIHERHVFPLLSVKAKRAFQGSVFLLGNAAHTIHPVAAQGLNIALHEVAVIADFIQSKHAQSLPMTPDDFPVLDQRMQAQQKVSLGLSDYLPRWLAKNTSPMHFALQLGMIGLDMLPFAKRNFINTIIGKRPYRYRHEEISSR